jgi:hypothetical protein
VTLRGAMLANKGEPPQASSKLPRVAIKAQWKSFFIGFYQIQVSSCQS